jgi:hypothetical protein
MIGNSKVALLCIYTSAQLLIGQHFLPLLEIEEAGSYLYIAGKQDQRRSPRASLRIRSDP